MTWASQISNQGGQSQQLAHGSMACSKPGSYLLIVGRMHWSTKGRGFVSHQKDRSDLFSAQRMSEYVYRVNIKCVQSQIEQGNRPTGQINIYTYKYRGQPVVVEYRVHLGAWVLSIGNFLGARSCTCLLYVSSLLLSRNLCFCSRQIGFKSDENFTPGQN